MRTSQLTIHSYYSPHAGWTAAKRNDLVMQTQLRLIKFHNGLPKALKISSSAQRPSFPHVYHMQYVVLSRLEDGYRADQPF